MTKPRIAHIIDDAHMGGIVRVLNRLASSELGENFDFDVVTMNSRWPVPRRLPHDVIVVHYTASWTKLPHLAMLRAMHPKTPLLIQEHSYSAGFEAHCVPTPKRFHKMLKLAYGLADRVLANSHSVAAWMLSNQLVDAEKLTTIPQCWDISELMDLAPPKPVTGRPLVVGAWGRFHPQKGFDDLIAAMAMVPPEHIRLRLGGMGADEGDLRRLAAGLRHVEFVGQVTDLKGFLAECDAVVIPSRWEPFGLVCLEAKAAARPMVVTSVDGLIEQADKFAHMVEPGNVTALAIGLMRLLTTNLAASGLAGRRDISSAWNIFVSDWTRQLVCVTSGEADVARGRLSTIPTTSNPGQNK